RVLANPRGTAPGLVLEREGRWVALLPGPPPEMRAVFEGGVRPLVLEVFAGRLTPVRIRTIHTTGIPESELAARVLARMPEPPGHLAVAFLPDLRGVDLRLIARGVGA